jgi:hypothetical protein
MMWVVLLFGLRDGQTGDEAVAEQGGTREAVTTASTGRRTARRLPHDARLPLLPVTVDDCQRLHHTTHTQLTTQTPPCHPHGVATSLAQSTTSAIVQPKVSQLPSLPPPHPRVNTGGIRTQSCERNLSRYTGITYPCSRSVRQRTSLSSLQAATGT